MLLNRPAIDFNPFNPLEKEKEMRKVLIGLVAALLVTLFAQSAMARWWDHKPVLRKEYTRWGMFKKLELTEDQAKLLKRHEAAVDMEFHKGLFSILTKRQIKKRAKLAEKREAWVKEHREKLRAALAKIEDEAKREEARNKFIEAVEWNEYLREYFFHKDVKKLLEKIKKHLRDNNDDPKPCMKALNLLQKKVDKLRAFYFPFEIRCRLGLTWLQHKMIDKRDKIRDHNWEAGVKDILTEEQYEYLQELRKERAEFYKALGDKFKERLAKKFEEEGENWNPFKKGKKGENGPKK